VVKHVQSELSVRGVGLCQGAQTASPLGQLLLTGETTTRLRITLTLRGAAAAERELELSTVPPDARSLAIAVATDELLAANWSEIERRAAAATPKPSPAPKTAEPARAPPSFFLGAPLFVLESFGGGQDLLGLDARASWRFASRIALGARVGLRQGLPEKSAHGSIHTSALLGGLGLRLELSRFGRTRLDVFGRADVVDLHATAYASPGARAHDASGLAVVTLGGLNLRTELSRRLSVMLEAGGGGVPRPVHLGDAGRQVSGIANWALALGGGIDVAF
jgi:hypothetical protein